MNPLSHLVHGLDYNTQAVPVASLTEQWTVHHPLGEPNAFGLEFVVASGGTIDVDIIIEQANTSPDPANANAADDNYQVPVGSSPVFMNVTAAGVYIVPFSPVPTKYFRVKLKGKGSNAATTTVKTNFVVTRLKG